MDGFTIYVLVYNVYLVYTFYELCVGTSPPREWKQRVNWIEHCRDYISTTLFLCPLGQPSYLVLAQTSLSVGMASRLKLLI
jgi:hypothetical protein